MSAGLKADATYKEKAGPVFALCAAALVSLLVDQTVFTALGRGWSEAERLTSAELDNDDAARLRQIVGR